MICCLAMVTISGKTEVWYQGQRGLVTEAQGMVPSSLLQTATNTMAHPPSNLACGPPPFQPLQLSLLLLRNWQLMLSSLAYLYPKAPSDELYTRCSAYNNHLPYLSPLPASTQILIWWVQMGARYIRLQKEKSMPRRSENRRGCA